MATLLYLLRHAKSSWADPGLPDKDRSLAPRGVQAARLIAAYISREQIRPGVVLCSTAVRALQTIEIIAPVFGGDVPLLVDDRLYGAEAEDLLSRLREVPDDVDAVLLVGHNPGLQELAIDLAEEGEAGALQRLKEKFPTGALATLASPGQCAALGVGTARLESLIVPRDLVT